MSTCRLEDSFRESRKSEVPEEFEFRVLTLNCWGLHFISRDRRRRLASIAEYLRTNASYTFVFLQEIWITADYDYIVKELAQVLPYSKRFTAGVIGSGLCIFSKVPIFHCLFIPFSANGYFYKFWHGDWFSGKGVGICCVLLNGLLFNLLTTHTHVETAGPEYIPHRVTQILALVDLLLLTSGPGSCDAAILAGDLNSAPDRFVMKLLLCLTGLQDTFAVAESRQCHPSLCSRCFPSLCSLDQKSKSPSLVTSCAHDGTCGLRSNAYSSRSDSKGDGWRLDYVLFKNCNAFRGGLSVVRYERPLPSRIPGLAKCSYSDHEAVAVTFRYTLHSTSPRPMETNDSKGLTRGVVTAAKQEEPSFVLEREKGQIIAESLNVLTQSLETLRCRFRICVVLAVLLLIFLLATVYEYGARWPTWAHVLANIARIILTFLLIAIGLIQPILLRQEIHALETGLLSVHLKCGGGFKSCYSSPPL